MRNLRERKPTRRTCVVQSAVVVGVRWCRTHRYTVTTASITWIVITGRNLRNTGRLNHFDIYFILFHYPNLQIILFHRNLMGWLKLEEYRKIWPLSIDFSLISLSKLTNNVPTLILIWAGDLKKEIIKFKNFHTSLHMQKVGQLNTFVPGLLYPHLYSVAT